MFPWMTREELDLFTTIMLPDAIHASVRPGIYAGHVCSVGIVVDGECLPPRTMWYLRRRDSWKWAAAKLYAECIRRGAMRLYHEDRVPVAAFSRSISEPVDLIRSTN